ncbi:UNVERIFIED_CONTAM: hypothetical protein GTU68_061716 [Idotea baltica]|nr:hypothetical protein [Idotea baltica]
MNITDERVLAAIGKIPRHEFIDSIFAEQAYANCAFEIDEEQTISHPYTVAFQTELLELKPTDKVLEIGTGSAYQASVLAEIGVKVYTIERIRSLFKKARRMLVRLGYSMVNNKLGDGFQGWEEHAPFDKIIVTAAAPEIPKKLIEQLAVGGKMVIPVGTEAEVRSESQQLMLLIEKNEDGTITETKKGGAAFVPMLRGKELKSRF